LNAFTEEQQAILREAFNHLWSRLEGLQDDLNDDTLRVSSALEVLAARGLLTDEEIDQVMARLHVEASHELQQEPQGITEQQITAAILGGDLEAFGRRQAEEEDED
jgi:hypothetical protein